MGFISTPQITGLVRGEPKPGARHRSNGKAVAGEMGQNEDGKRHTASETYDRSRTHMNQYTGYTNGYEAWDYIEERANGYKIKGKTKDGKEYERSLRSDAVVGYAVIFNPPDDVCINWSDEDYEKFYNDSWDYMCQKQPRLFSNRNKVMTAEHYDEGLNPDGKSRHCHILGEARDSDGKYCGNLIDAKMLSEINREYPAFMRSRGWDMEDLDCTDWDKYNSDSAYREERIEKAKTNGLSINQYGKKLSAEEAMRIAQEKQALKDREDELQAERDKFTAEKEKWQEKANNELTEALLDIQTFKTKHGDSSMEQDMREYMKLVKARDGESMYNHFTLWRNDKIEREKKQAEEKALSLREKLLAKGREANRRKQQQEAAQSTIKPKVQSVNENRVTKPRIRKEDNQRALQQEPTWFKGVREYLDAQQRFDVNAMIRIENDVLSENTDFITIEQAISEYEKAQNQSQME